MGRREYTIRLRCTHEGCTETSFTTATTRREETEIRSRYAKSPYLCVRHTKPDEVLSTENLERTLVVVAQKVEARFVRGIDTPGEVRYLDGLFWDGRSGFNFGPGFKAYASDFPEGTRLVVTARIELPVTGSEGNAGEAA